MDCIFCKIAKKQIRANIIFEDKHSLAFLDNNPHTKGHTIVIPKEHGQTFFDISDNSNKELMLSTKKTAKLIEQKLSCDGFNIGWNHNTAAGQVVPHLHVHIMPRYNNDNGGSMHSIINNPSNLSVNEVFKLFKSY